MSQHITHYVQLYRDVTGLQAVYNNVMNRVQFEHPQPGVDHPEAFVTVSAQQFMDHFQTYVAGRLPQ